MEDADVADFVCSVTRPKARQAPRRRVPAGSVTPGEDCNKAEPPLEEYRVHVDAAVDAECPEVCPSAGKDLDDLESKSWG